MYRNSPLVFGFYMADALEVAIRNDGGGGGGSIDGPHRDQLGYKGATLLPMSCWHLFASAGSKVAKYELIKQYPTSSCKTKKWSL